MAKINILDATGQSQGDVSIKVASTKKEVAPAAFAALVHVLRQNGRQGTVSVKGRGDVSFSGKKPWKQKGTGRARAGTISSPLFRKGGVIFGPQKRTRTLKVPTKLRSRVLSTLFAGIAKQGSILCVDFDRGKEGPNTKAAASMLKGVGLAGKKIALVLPWADAANITSFRNIPKVHILFFDQANVYDLTKVTHWLFLKKDVDSFKEMVARWH